MAHMTEAAFAELRARPGFRPACNAAASAAVGYFQGLEPPLQWITKDIGRSGICLTALILDMLGRLTVQTLTAASVESLISSPGRVSQVVRRCQEMGAFVIDDGPGLWTRRPAHVGPAIREMMRGRWIVDFGPALSLAPEVAGAFELRHDDAAFRTYFLHLARVTGLLPGIFAHSKGSPIDYFLEREAGMLILFELLGAQAPDRSRFLEEARISRYALSQRYGVSRAHINKVLSESGHAEASGDRVSFSRELSDGLERHFSIIFQMNIGGARAMLSRHGAA
jgi:hypothetical protein